MYFQKCNSTAAFRFRSLSWFWQPTMHHSQSQRRWKPESHRHWEFWIGLFVCIMTIQLLGITSGKYQTLLVCAQWKHPCSMHVSGLIIFYSSNLWLPQVHFLCQHAHDPLRVPTEPTPSEEAMVQLVSTGVHLKRVQISIETLLITRFFFSKLDVSTIHEILPDIKHHVPDICLKNLENGMTSGRPHDRGLWCFWKKWFICAWTHTKVNFVGLDRFSAKGIEAGWIGCAESFSEFCLLL